MHTQTPTFYIQLYIDSHNMMHQKCAGTAWTC